MGLIDSHCHLHYDYSPKSSSDLVREAQLAGVSTLVSVGTDIASIKPIQEISKKHDCVFHTVGVHPHDVSGMNEGDLETLELAARDPKCVAIGEIGLDYHYEHSPRDVQKLKLKHQLELAAKIKLPVVIHSRDAEDDLLAALKVYCRSLSKDHIPGVIHCFTGTVGFGKACIELGFYISFSGILTFKNAEDLRSAAREFPLDRLLVETDSPYLAPIPFRGKKCEPSMVKTTAEKLAEVKGVPFETIANYTSENAKKVFRFTARR